MSFKVTPNDLVLKNIDQFPEMEHQNGTEYSGFSILENDTDSGIEQQSMEDIFGVLIFFCNKSNAQLISGLSFNVLGVIISGLLLRVLMLKKTRNPFNFLLIAMAFVNILLMLSYATCVLMGKTAVEADLRNVYLSNIIAACLTNTLHMLSTWIAVLLSILRLMYVRTCTQKRERKSWNTLIRISLLFVTLLSVICVAPLYGLSDEQVTLPENVTMHEAADLDFKSAHEVSLLSMYSFFGKILPCFITVAVGGCLVYIMTFKGKSQILVNGKRNRHMKISTILLVTIVVLFVISELPPGTMILLSLSGADLTAFHLYTEDAQDCIALLVSTINLALYCAMSQGFRAQFRKTYLRSRRSREVMTTSV